MFFQNIFVSGRKEDGANIFKLHFSKVAENFNGCMQRYQWNLQTKAGTNVQIICKSVWIIIDWQANKSMLLLLNWALKIFSHIFFGIFPLKISPLNQNLFTMNIQYLLLKMNDNHFNSCLIQMAPNWPFHHLRAKIVSAHIQQTLNDMPSLCFTIIILSQLHCTDDNNTTWYIM